MLKYKKNNTLFYKFNNLSEYNNIKHFVSTRKGGVSSPPIDEMNIGFTVGDDYENVVENRKILASAVDIPLESFVFQNQIHGDNIKIIDKSYPGKCVYDYPKALLQNDAMITNEKNICLFVFTADCVPVLLYDPVKKVIAAVHAGWKGTVKKIVQKTILKMKEDFNCKAENIAAGIGPSISVQHYEVGKNVEKAVFDSFGTKEKYPVLNPETKKYHFDLWYTNKKQLIDSGILEKNIETSELCTYEHKELFFSARRDKYSGRTGAGIISV